LRKVEWSVTVHADSNAFERWISQERYRRIIHGDGSKGYSKYAPYDAIIVTAGAPTIPQELMKQLKIGGRLVIPVGTERNSQEMFRITRNSETHFKREKFGDFKFVPLVGEDGWL
jgi:protein-L-isoaspartate(D-aspartate) O-methyltransferase